MKKRFTEEEKRRAVADYVSGRRSAEQVSRELGVPRGYLYRWRVEFGERAKGARIDELEEQGHNRDQIRQILKLEEELVEYKKMVGEQALVIDLLKKLQNSSISQRESAVTGLLDSLKKSDQSKKPARS